MLFLDTEDHVLSFFQQSKGSQPHYNALCHAYSIQTGLEPGTMGSSTHNVFYFYNFFPAQLIINELQEFHADSAST